MKRLLIPLLSLVFILSCSFIPPNDSGWKKTIPDRHEFLAPLAQARQLLHCTGLSSWLNPILMHGFY